MLGMLDLDFSNTSSEISDISPELVQPEPDKRLVSSNRVRIMGGLVVLMLVSLSILIALQLGGENQDNRQQAKFCDDNPDSPYYDAGCSATGSLTPSPSTTTPTLTASPTINPNKDRPKTEANCSGQGFWLNNSCYLFWETLPGDTHVVVPPGISGKSYATLVPKDQAFVLQGSTPTSTPTSTPITSSTPTPSVVYDFSIDGKCNSPFYMVGGKCVPNQKDPAWDSRWINTTGCGAMQTLYYAMKKDPNLDINAFLNEHYAEYINANQSANTPTQLNVDLIEDLGYSVEPYKGSLTYHGEKFTDNGDTIFVGALFGSSINHFASIDRVSHNSDGTTTLNMVDSYFGADKCISAYNNPNAYNCYNNKGEKVTSLNLETASIYVVSDNAI